MYFLTFISILSVYLTTIALGYETTQEPELTSPLPPPQSVDENDMWNGHQGGSIAHTRYGNRNRNDENRPTNNFTRRNYLERYGSPEGCVLSEYYWQSCSYYVEISKHENQKYDDALLFELMVHIKENDFGFVAVGLSQDQKMGQDHMIECVKARSGLTMYHSWAETKTEKPHRLREDINVFEMEEHYPFYDPRNETLTCKFWRKIKTSFFVGNRPKEIDLIRGKYFILLAEGPLESKVGSDMLGYHGDKPLETGNAYVSKNLLGFSTQRFPSFGHMYGKHDDGSSAYAHGRKPQRPNGKNDGGHAKPIALVIMILGAISLL